MPEREQDRFFMLYERLIASAARVQVVPPGGLTPAELRDYLKEKGFAAPDDLERVTALLERCVYGPGGTDDECRDGRALCESLALRLPPPEAPPREGGAAGLAAWVGRHAVWLAPAAVSVLLILALMTFGRGCNFSFGGGSTAALSAVDTAWGQAYSLEANAAVQAQGGWKSLPSQPIWKSIDLDPVIDSRVFNAQTTCDMDLSTQIEGYYKRRDEVFDPPLNWTHRLLVYTSVDSQYNFHADGLNMRPAQGSSDDNAKIYKADVRVMLQPGQPLPVPSPSADAVVTGATTSPRINGTFTKDGADGLYFTSSHGGEVRLHYTLATWNDYSFAPLPEEPFQPAPATLPPNVMADARVVIDAIGGLPAPTYAETVRRLHSYFAGFTVGPIDQTRMASNMFLTMALQRRGVCRHRARSFFVVANALGVETRLVENQRHSFCEVRLPDGGWRRLEFRLEGASGSSGSPAATHPQYGSSVGDSQISAVMPFMAVAVLAVLMFALIGARRRDDVGGHVVTALMSDDHSLERARRDEDIAAAWQVTADLVRLVRGRLIDRLGLRPAPPYGLRASFKRVEVPKPMQECAINIMEFNLEALGPETESAVLDDCFWDCLRVMYFLERMGAIEPRSD